MHYLATLLLLRGLHVCTPGVLGFHQLPHSNSRLTHDEGAWHTEGNTSTPVLVELNVSRPLDAEVADFRGPRLVWAVTAISLLAVLTGLGTAALCTNLWGETSEKDESSTGSGKWWALKAFLFAAALLCLLMPLIPYLAGALVRLAVEHYDTAYLGVDVHIDQIRFNPFNGKLVMEGLQVDNPPGWKSDYLLQVSGTFMDLDMLPLIFSLGNKRIVEDLIQDGVDVIYETSVVSSNVDEVSGYLSSQSGGSGSLVLHRVDIRGIWAKYALSALNAAGVSIHVADIHFDDFSNELNSDGVADDIVKILLTTVLEAAKRSLSR